MATPLILIIEDDSHIGGLVSEVLREAGYRTHLLPDANAARATAQAAAQGTDDSCLRPDALIADLVVEGMGPPGEVASQLDRLFPGVPFTLMTGVPPNRRAQLGVNHGLILEKPFDLETLLDAVVAMVGPAELPTASPSHERV